jgi:hypothetical protein
MTVPASPAARVLATFGAVGVPEPLAGGTGRSWRAGSLVLKPLDYAEREISRSSSTAT